MTTKDLVEQWTAFLELVVAPVQLLRPAAKWMPTLHLDGRTPVSIVVAKASSLDEYRDIAGTIDQELRLEDQRNDLLIVGSTWHVPGRAADFSVGDRRDLPVAGLLDQRDVFDGNEQSSFTGRAWCEAAWVECGGYVGVMHTEQSFHVRPHGDHIYGDHGAEAVEFMELERAWHLARRSLPPDSR